MVLGYHANDFKQLPNEDQAMDTMRGLNIPPGYYSVPKANSMKDLKTESFKSKMARGPVMFMSVRTSDMSMGKNLIQWFIFCLVVSIFSAYVGTHTSVMMLHI